jgi:hypothetical protein
MPIKVSREDNLTLPAYTGAIITNYAQPVTSDGQSN